jgi:hypothetical protein
MNKKPIFALALVAMLIMSPVAGAAEPVSLNYSESSDAPNPVLDADLDKKQHDMSNMSLFQYENDNGEIESLPANLNDSNENPITLTATNIQVADFSDFPRDEFYDKSGDGEKNTEVSVLDATHWTTDETNTAGTISVTNVDNNGVDALEIATDSVADTESASSTFTVEEPVNDANKRYAAFGVDVDQLDAGTTVTVSVVDDDGDEKQFVIDSSADSSAATTIATATGDGYVTQQQLGSVDTVDNGDGNFDNIESLSVTSANGDADVDFTLINSEKKSAYVFGEQRVDSDDDGELDSAEEITEPAGEYTITGLDSLGDVFSTSTIYDLQIDAHLEASELSDEDAQVEALEAEQYPGYDSVLDVNYRFTLPSQYDLSWSNAELTDSPQLPSERYDVEYAEGTGDTAFGDIDTFSSVDFAGDTVVDSTIQPGQSLVLHYEIKVTADELDSMTAVAGGGPMGASGGAWYTSIPVIGGVIGIIIGIVGRVVGGGE